MIELIIGTYGVACWLVFKKYKLIPVTTYTVCTAILGGIGILVGLYILLSVFHPVAHDGRMYGPVVQIVPNVRGTVVEVPVTANTPVKRGEVLFIIDPEPYRIEVERLRALLVTKQGDVVSKTEQAAAARAAVAEERANLTVAESQFDRQARESYEQAAAHRAQVKKRLDLASTQFERAKTLLRSKNISQEEYDRDQAKMLALEEEMRQAVAGENIAKEKLGSGSASVSAVMKKIERLEAEERDLQAQISAKYKDMDAREREVLSQLEKALWDLEQTTVRAPADGYVPQVTLRPGQMAVALPFKPLMVFVVTEQPVLVATFEQKAISDVKPGMDAEVVFKAFPGKSFKVKVRRVMTAIPEGEVLAAGQIMEATSASEKGRIPVVFDYGDDVAALNLPIGAQASIAIYTDRVHALSIVRKIVLRMKSWESYLF